MLYLCIGEQYESRKKKYDALICTLQNKRPNSELVVLDPEEESSIALLEQHISSIGLFDEKSIIKASGVFENPGCASFVLNNINEIVASDNVFVLSEHKLSKQEHNTLDKAGATIYEFSAPQTNKNPSLFYLGDLLLQKNKSKLWLAIWEELGRGISIEELVGILVWQSKSLHLALTHSQTQSGLKSFVYNKCTRSPWKAQEAQKLHLELVTIYHESRRGGLDLSERVEQLVLSI